MSLDFDARFFDLETSIPDDPYPQLPKIIKSARTGLARCSQEEMLSLYDTVSEIIDRHTLWNDAALSDLIDAIDQEADNIKSYKASDLFYALTLILGSMLFLSNKSQSAMDFILAAQQSIHAANASHEADFRKVNASFKEKQKQHAVKKAVEGEKRKTASAGGRGRTEKYDPARKIVEQFFMDHKHDPAFRKKKGGIYIKGMTTAIMEKFQDTEAFQVFTSDDKYRWIESQISKLKKEN